MLSTGGGVLQHITFVEC